MMCAMGSWPVAPAIPGPACGPRLAEGNLLVSEVCTSIENTIINNNVCCSVHNRQKMSPLDMSLLYVSSVILTQDNVNYMLCCFPCLAVVDLNQSVMFVIHFNMLVCNCQLCNLIVLEKMLKMWTVKIVHKRVTLCTE